MNETEYYIRTNFFDSEFQTEHMDQVEKAIQSCE